MCICDFNTVANIEPAIITIYNCKVGTDIELVEENGKKFFLDSNTGEVFESQYLLRLYFRIPNNLKTPARLFIKHHSCCKAIKNP